MIPYLIVGIVIVIYCAVLMFILGSEDKYGLRTPNRQVTFVFAMMILAVICFISAKGEMRYNTKYRRIETLIKTKSIDGVVKSDTLIRIVKKK